MQPSPLSPTSDLLKQTLAEARELVQLEVRIAKEELKEEVVRVKKAAITGGVALVLLFAGLSGFVVALILAFGGTVVAALLVAGALLVLGAGAGVLAYSMVPKSPLSHTRQNLKDDVNQLKEHVA